MKFRYNISKNSIDNLFKLKLQRFYLLNKRDIVVVCFYVSMMILYYGSLHPWFLWPLRELYPIPAAGILLLGYMISKSMEEPLFSRHDYLPQLSIYTLLSFYILFVGNQNVNAYITNVFTIFVFYCLFRSNKTLLINTVTVIAKSMALLLIPSMFFFMLYLLAFPLPSRNAVFGDNNYSFINYYFFMIDDRFLLVLIPRFQSVFLEPGHLGTATSLLLMTQIGKWKRWWNVTLLIATIISFSLAAYAILISLIFLGLWIQRKNIIGKLLGAISLIAIVAVTATFYNDGDNLVNNLILARLEVDDKTGEMVGNNRVDENFEREFDKFMESSDVLFGRDMSRIPKGSGNSGYRVFIYSNGLIGLILVVLLYAFSFRAYEDKRYLVTVIFISLLIFWIRGYPLWYSNFIPILATVYKVYTSSKTKRKIIAVDEP